jgi:SAM-dependent methyltransferase
MMPPPVLERHFVRGSFLGWLLRGHPYDFVETYRVVRALYGYRAWYVNLGLWAKGAATVEPGRALALRVADELALCAGESAIDAGAGLGQAAVDLCQTYRLGSVRGINVNQRQVAFARELAQASGLEGRITHVVADACSALSALPARSCDGVLAIECVGHFSDPLGFLRGARHVLRPGRRLAFCLNVANRELTFFQRMVIRTSFGFLPATRQTWEERLASAGFEEIRAVDLTAEVTGALCRALDERLARPTETLSALPWTTRAAVRWLSAVTHDAVRTERVKYLLVTAKSP